MDPELQAAIDAINKKFKDKLTEVNTQQTALTEKMVLLEEKQLSEEDVTDINGRIKDSSEALEELGEEMITLTKEVKASQALEKGPGRQLAETKDFSEKIMSGEKIEVKDITAGSFDPTTLPGGHRRGHRGMIEPVNQALHLRDILPNGTTDAAVMEYMQESGYTNNADVVPAGDLKPQSELTFTAKTALMQKLAHYFRVNEETLDDVDGMETYINQRGIYGLLLKEEDKLLNGAGGGADVDGLALAANHTAYSNTLIPGVVPDNAMDDVRVMIAQVQEADLMASGVVMNHLDAAALDLTKDADGNYLHPAFAANTAWGLPVVRTKAIPQGKIMVGGFMGNVILWQKKGLEVRRSTEDRDNFVRNKVTILIEERIGLEILRPEGIVYGDLS